MIKIIILLMAFTALYALEKMGPLDVLVKSQEFLIVINSSEDPSLQVKDSISIRLPTELEINVIKSLVDSKVKSHGIMCDLSSRIPLDQTLGSVARFFIKAYEDGRFPLDSSGM